MRKLLLKPFRFVHNMIAGAPPDPRKESKTFLTDCIARLRAQHDTTLTYLNIGASGGSSDLWDWLIRAQLINAVMIDMAEWGDSSLQSQSNVTTIKAAVGETESLQQVSITRHPACSSCLPPNPAVLESYPVKKWFEVVTTFQVNIRSYCSIAAEYHTGPVHFVKMDVQGYEGPVLRGMRHHLEAAVCVEFECQMKPIYLGQDTFFDLYRWMVDRGFRLRDLRPQGPFEGEALEFNSFWSRHPRNAAEQLMVKVWESACGVWPGIYFADADAHQRKKYAFNDIERI